MSLSINRHSEGSITYCDEFESDDDVIQERRSQSQTDNLEEGDLDTQTPKIRLSHPQFFGKENASVESENPRMTSSDKRRRSKALQTLCSENQSLKQNGVQSATSQKKTRGMKHSKRATTSFEIFRPDGVDSPHGPFTTPVKQRRGVSVGLLSPEYEPAYNSVKVESKSFTRATKKEQEEQLVQMFPNADPDFLKSESNRMNAPLGDVVNSILSQMEKNEIPAKENKKRIDSKHGTDKFSVEKLLKVVKDPWSYFGDKRRDCSGYTDHSLHYLKTKFRKFYNQTITDALLFHNQNLYLACQYLKKKNRGLKLRMTNRPMSECNACKPNTVNLQFLLEVSFIEHEEEVKNYMKNQKAAKKIRLKEAIRLGLLVKCESCQGESLLPEDVVTCSAGHSFCKECIARHIQSRNGSGIDQVQCLGPCRQEYPLQVLQEVLTPDLFSKLMETLKTPNDTHLARCPFCSYTMYLPPDATVVACLNIQCLKESCRLCKGATHEPMKCEAITLLSDQCWQCRKEVAKVEGCNEMVCSCGGKTCHVCKQPVRDHSHFFLYEEENGAKCPLYSTD